MPCWYYEKKELKNTPSYLDSIDSLTESRYRREGARFIFDAGTKMGLRYDSCSTGVVYFHRFYMFHSFKEFHRYVTGACCLFLAGKVEETPKKCKDIIKTCRSLLTEQQFSVFGEDPREEVMTLERILLQTIKFDLQVEHPYTRLLHYAKLLKGDKQKIQKVVQMAWTFINDSMCTMLCLQWEPDIISVSMLYLATRLSKLDIQDWVGKPPGSKLKWWEGLVEDLSQELIEDICHLVLDLYSSKSQKREESPPISASQKPDGNLKRNRNSSPLDDRLQAKKPSGKSSKLDKSLDESLTRSSRGHPEASHGSHPPTQAPYSAQPPNPPGGVNTRTGGHHPGNPAYAGADNSNYNQFNPYGSSQSFSSFMSQEGSQSIQSLITGGDGGKPYSDGPPTHDYQGYQQAGYQPQPGYGNNPPPQAQAYPPPSQQYAGYQPPPAAYPAPGAPPNHTPQGYPGGAYQNQPPQQFNYNPDFNQQAYPQSFPPAGQPAFQNNTYGPPRGPPVKKAKNAKNKNAEPPNPSTCLTQVRITGR